MSQSISRRMGRPDAQAVEEIGQRILSTATRLFIEHGYAATSMEQITATAGVSKQTIYRRYVSKEELFVAVIRDLAASLLETSVTGKTDLQNPLVGLNEACWALLQLTARSETVALFRILIAEAVRFPDLVVRVKKAAMQPIEDVMRFLLHAAREAGLIRHDIPEEDMVNALTGMSMGWFFQQRLLGHPCMGTETERRFFFDNAWDMFLAGARA
ncbi:MAG: TetR/AcrR family transcriptional regulator [Paludibacterium sp.]|uniref:TetR/AcrR family transcriptional regulator n=1 Tax=Paludibacterium sp. TaxID=1917523 RepID=UPI0025F9EF9B|nr:TetR/AcrR family transcriptional regulator [Paludibacterium sp.]MBV8049331.1 TetR/AcrR family transcriptional regulator [Paludibacterium sp.]MBV8646826.1 TetR/AcrR family transcriptional regulator [Paludibacterium sp.]